MHDSRAPSLLLLLLLLFTVYCVLCTVPGSRAVELPCVGDALRMTAKPVPGESLALGHSSSSSGSTGMAAMSDLHGGEKLVSSVPHACNAQASATD